MEAAPFTICRGRRKTLAAELVNRLQRPLPPSADQPGNCAFGQPWMFSDHGGDAFQQDGVEVAHGVNCNSVISRASPNVLRTCLVAAQLGITPACCVRGCSGVSGSLNAVQLDAEESP